MSTGKEKRTEIEVSFYIRDAEDIQTSDFNIIILRLNQLREFIDSNCYHNETEIAQINYNIEAIQSLLNNFKIIEVPFRRNNEKSNTL